jgi:hypothetical protein
LTEHIKSFRDIIGAIERSEINAPQLGMPRQRFMGNGKHAENAAADPRGRAVNEKYHDQPEAEKRKNQETQARWLAMSAEQRAAYTARCRDGYRAPVDVYALAEAQRAAQARAALAKQQEEWKRGER